MVELIRYSLILNFRALKASELLEQMIVTNILIARIRDNGL